MGCNASKEPEAKKKSWFGPFGLHTPSILEAISFPFEVYDPLSLGKSHSEDPKLAKAPCDSVLTRLFRSYQQIFNFT
ncbi:hypothetical protein R1sor_019079 [Riccia sorocarpa]|uniref:Uncharacterized protein n=1 Tax=Riccia sorocarpa TaxID=122646 RepID=A0ABD3IBP0_9MARC